MQRRLLVDTLFALGLVPLAACHRHADVVVTIPAVPVYAESERNDDAWSANDFGTLFPGGELRIIGSIRDDPFDPRDGFAFRASGSIRVEFVLTPECSCADLDVWVYDPWLDAFVGAFEAPYGPERGSLVVHGQPFHLVVVSAHGDSNYQLDVRASGLYFAQDADATGMAGIVLEPEAAADHPQRAPRTVPEAYRAVGRRTGPVEHVEVFVLDPELGVVETLRLVAPAR